MRSAACLTCDHKVKWFFSLVTIFDERFDLRWADLTSLLVVRFDCFCTVFVLMPVRCLQSCAFGNCIVSARLTDMSGPSLLDIGTNVQVPVFRVFCELWSNTFRQSLLGKCL